MKFPRGLISFLDGVSLGGKSNFAEVWVGPCVEHPENDRCAPPPKCSYSRLYWWRAQSAAYVVRFSHPAAALLCTHQHVIYPYGDVPRGTISVHVRRGDKARESELRSDEEFLAEADAILLESRKRGGSGVPTLAPAVYLSTEDVLTEAFFLRSNFIVTATHVPRFHTSSVPVIQAAKARGYDPELADSFVSLKLALQCDAFVGQLSSNWVRLIDELRSTVRCKAHAPFWDPQQKDGNFSALGW